MRRSGLLISLNVGFKRTDALEELVLSRQGMLPEEGLEFVEALHPRSVMSAVKRVAEVIRGRT